MTEMVFAFGDGAMNKLDQIQMRCGHENPAEVLDAALCFYDIVSGAAADGCRVVEVMICAPETDDEAGECLCAEVGHERFTEAYHRARAEEREVLPGEEAPAPVRRPWWRRWFR